MGTFLDGDNVATHYERLKNSKKNSSIFDSFLRNPSNHHDSRYWWQNYEHEFESFLRSSIIENKHCSIVTNYKLLTCNAEQDLLQRDSLSFSDLSHSPGLCSLVDNLTLPRGSYQLNSQYKNPRVGSADLDAVSKSVHDPCPRSIIATRRVQSSALSTDSSVYPIIDMEIASDTSSSGIASSVREVNVLRVPHVLDSSHIRSIEAKIGQNVEKQTSTGSSTLVETTPTSGTGAASIRMGEHAVQRKVGQSIHTSPLQNSASQSAASVGNDCWSSTSGRFGDGDSVLDEVEGFGAPVSQYASSRRVEGVTIASPPFHASQLIQKRRSAAIDSNEALVFSALSEMEERSNDNSESNTSNQARLTFLENCSQHSLDKLGNIHIPSQDPLVGTLIISSPMPRALRGYKGQFPLFIPPQWAYVKHSPASLTFGQHHHANGQITNKIFTLDGRGSVTSFKQSDLHHDTSLLAVLHDAELQAIRSEVLNFLRSPEENALRREAHRECAFARLEGVSVGYYRYFAGHMTVEEYVAARMCVCWEHCFCNKFCTRFGDLICPCVGNLVVEDGA